MMKGQILKRGDRVKLTALYASTAKPKRRTVTGKWPDWTERVGTVIHCSARSASVMWDGRASYMHVPLEGLVKVEELEAIRSSR